MVVHFFRLQRNPRHEGKSLDKRIELEIRSQSGVFIFPARQDFQSIIEFVGIKGLVHVSNMLQEILQNQAPSD